jgi:hypothetical protein
MHASNALVAGCWLLLSAASPFSEIHPTGLCARGRRSNSLRRVCREACGMDLAEGGLTLDGALALAVSSQGARTFVPSPVS